MKKNTLMISFFIVGFALFLLSAIFVDSYIGQALLFSAMLNVAIGGSILIYIVWHAEEITDERKNTDYVKLGNSAGDKKNYFSCRRKPAPAGN
jgi:hypothetical protein